MIPSPEDPSEQPPEETPQEAAQPLGFDLEILRLGQNFGDSVGAKKALITVPVKKPNRQDFIRVRPGEDWRLQTNIIELKEDRETHLVLGPLWAELAHEVTPVCLVTAINRQRVVFIWPLKLPREREMEWHRSAAVASTKAETSWVSVRSNMDLAAYEVYEATGDLGEPEWPDATFEEILAIAFKDRVIDSFDHPVLKRLRGEQ